MVTKCGRASIKWWRIRQQYAHPASAANRAGRKSAKARVRASSLEMQNWSSVWTSEAMTSALTALLSSPSRFRNGLQRIESLMSCPLELNWLHFTKQRFAMLLASQQWCATAISSILHIQVQQCCVNTPNLRPTDLIGIQSSGKISGSVNGAHWQNHAES